MYEKNNHKNQITDKGTTLAPQIKEILLQLKDSPIKKFQSDILHQLKLIFHTSTPSVCNRCKNKF